MRAAALFFLIGVAVALLGWAPAHAAEIQPTPHNQKSKIGRATSADKLHKNRRIAQTDKTRRAASAGALQKRFAAARSAPKRPRSPHPSMPNKTKLVQVEAVDVRSGGWMGRLEIIGMADRADTPEPSLHWDIAGQTIAAGRFPGFLRISPSRSLIVWPINPAYDISALTTAEGKLADPDIEWDDVEGDAVINPPSADDQADNTQPALSPNQYYAGLIEDRVDAPLPKIDVGTVTWNSAAQISTQKTHGPVEVAKIDSAPADISARIFVCCRAAAGAAPSQLVLDVVFASQPKTDKIDALENPEARQTGDIHGELLHAEIQTQGANWFRFLLSMTPGDFDENFKLLISRPWIDVPVRFESGRRAILTFATGKIGADAIYAAVHSTD